MIFVLIVLSGLIQFCSHLLFAYALLLWFPGAYNTWLGRAMGQLVEPVIRPLRCFNLQFMGLGFTILTVVIALNVSSRVLIMIFT